MALPLAPETTVKLTVDGHVLAVLMCTPRNLDDLAAAHLFYRDAMNVPESEQGEHLSSGFTVAMASLKSWARAMFEAADLYRLTGGMHCAALASGNQSHLAGTKYFVVREDVGRHNAIDKVIGRGCLDLVDFSSSCILTSGRIAADMVLKMAAARIPVIVSRSIPTTAAFEFAQRIGLTMVGRIGDDAPIVYTNQARIL